MNKKQINVVQPYLFDNLIYLGQCVFISHGSRASNCACVIDFPLCQATMGTSEKEKLVLSNHFFRYNKYHEVGIYSTLCI